MQKIKNFIKTNKKLIENNIPNENSKIVNNFTQNIKNLVNNRTEQILNKYIKQIKNKNKSILNDIKKENLLNLNNIIFDNLNNLWNDSFFSNEINNNSFELKKTLITFNKEVEKKIRTRNEQEQKRTEKILKIKNTKQTFTDFSNDYLNLRNKEIAKNFTETYKEKIFDGISKYINGKVNFNKEKNLINHLSFRNVNELNTEEKKLYINELNLEKERIKQVYGLNLSENYGNLKWNAEKRIQRIALTESSAAYNLGRFNKLVDQGFTEFIIRKNKKSVCVLCQSLNGQLVTLDELINIGYQDFKGIDTRQPYTHPKNNKLGKFGQFHPNCSCSLIGNPKQTKEELQQNIENKNNNIQNLINNVLGIYNKYNKISNLINISKGLSNTYLNYLQEKQDKKEEENNNIRLKLLLSSSAILSSSLMIFYYLKNKQNVDNLVQEQIGEKLIEVPLNVVQENQDKLTEIIKNKTITKNNQFQYYQKPLESSSTVNNFVDTNNKKIITQNLISNIKNYIDKETLKQLLNKTFIKNIDFTSSIQNKNDLLKYNELELLIKTLIKNENIQTNEELLNLIYKDTKNNNNINTSVLKIPINLKEEEKILINPLEEKQIEINNKLILYNNSMSTLYKNIKEHKINYLKDIEKLKELDSNLTDELIGIDYLNKQYNSLLDTTNDENLKKYLNNKIEENKNKSLDIRVKLNNISEELYDKNYKNIDKLSITEKNEYKSQLLDDIKINSEEYLNFRNNKNSDIKSLNTKLNNLKTQSNNLLNKNNLNIEEIDKLLDNTENLINQLKELDKKSLSYDKVLYDISLLSRLDNEINIKDLNYLTRTYEFNKEINLIDNFKIDNIETYKNKLNSYIKDLTKTKYNLLNKESISITKFKFFGKILKNKLKIKLN